MSRMPCSLDSSTFSFGASIGGSSRHVFTASRSCRTGRRRISRCSASQGSDNLPDNLRAGLNQFWSNISRSARNSLDSLRGGSRPQAPSSPQPTQPTDVTSASQESKQQAAAAASQASSSEQEASSTQPSEEDDGDKTDVESYVLSEGDSNVWGDMEQTSFIVPETIADGDEQGIFLQPDAVQGMHSSEMMDFSGVNELRIAGPALPDLTVLANNQTPMNWEDWYKHIFLHKDRAAHRMEQLQTSLDTSVAAEDYEDAAEYSDDLARHQRFDDISKIWDEYSLAIKNEDFKRAAALRDEGGAGLVGWWVRDPSPSDPTGHLLRISPSYGRYLGLTFTARDIATHEAPSQVMPGGMGQGMEIIEEGTDMVQMQTEGTPWMEVWVQRNEDGTFNRQTTLLRPPMDDLQLLKDAESASDSSATGSNAESSDRTSETDGKIELNAETWDRNGSPEATSSSDDASTSSSSSSTEASRPGDNFTGSGSNEIRGRLPSRLRRQRHRNRSYKTDKEQKTYEAIDAFMKTDPKPGNYVVNTDEGTATVTVGNQQQTAPTVHEGLQFGGTSFQHIMNLIRHPATLTNLGRHQLVIQADEQLTAQEQQIANATKSLASKMAAGKKVPLQLTIQNANGQEVENVSFDETEGKDSIEEMTEQVMAAMRRHDVNAGSEMVTKETLTDIIRTATMQFLHANSGSTLGKNGQMTYTRLDLTAAPTDPFCGVFLGSFGGNGLELLQINRAFDKDGDESVIATKLTGDPNVPAGQISFKAKINRSNKLSTREAYPADLGVVGRYRGHGRIAKAGNKDARWVEGELLRFASNNPATRGAELGFVWTVPQDKRYLVLLNKIELDDPVEAHNEEQP